MIPLGSVGGCHSKVTEEAVTFAKVTFCGGSNGSESQGAKTRTHRQKCSGNVKILIQIHCEEYCQNVLDIYCQKSIENDQVPASVVVKLI